MRQLLIVCKHGCQGGHCWIGARPGLGCEAAGEAPDVILHVQPGAVREGGSQVCRLQCTGGLQQHSQRCFSYLCRHNRGCQPALHGMWSVASCIRVCLHMRLAEQPAAVGHCRLAAALPALHLYRFSMHHPSHKVIFHSQLHSAWVADTSARLRVLKAWQAQSWQAQSATKQARLCCYCPTGCWRVAEVVWLQGRRVLKAASTMTTDTACTLHKSHPAWAQLPFRQASGCKLGLLLC